MEMTLKYDGRKVRLGACDEKGKNAAVGIGLIWKEEEVSVYAEAIRGQEMTKAKDAGRVGKYMMSMGWERGYMVYPIYGKSGGTRIYIAMTNAILQSIQRGIEGDTYGPKIRLGDFNHIPNLMATLKDLMKEQQWLDVGSVADWWGGVPDETICHGRGKAQKSRIDGYMASIEALGRSMITRLKK